VPPYSLVVSSPAFRALRGFDAQERAEIRRLLRLIQVDPSIDGHHKILAPRPPAIFTAYVGQRVWIFYRVVGSTIHVETIEHATGQFPTPW